MEKRYQVFVSSTFRDLVEERRQIMQALLEIDCIPAGMELFPAADEGAWELIKRVIDQSDYYVLAVGGRYGSMDKSGVSYTEREYEYAVTTKKQILAFLHEVPEEIPAGKTELNPDARTKLQEFRKKVEDKHTCKYWRNADDLGGKISRALITATKLRPTGGWVRGEQVKTVEDVQRLADLQERIASLQSENEHLKEKLYEVQLDQQKSAESVPRIAGDYPGFLRRFKIEWDAEARSKRREMEAANQLLDSVREELLGYAVEVDEERHFHIANRLQDMVLRITELMRSEFGLDDVAYWTEGESIISDLKHLCWEIENEQWSVT